MDRQAGRASASGERAVATASNTGIIVTGDHATIVQLGASQSAEGAGALSHQILLRQLDLGPNFERYTGRQWLLAELDRFVDQYGHGWFVLDGEAGVGKSSFAAATAVARGWPHHFCGLPSGGEPARAVRSLAAQVIVAERLSASSLGVLGPETPTPEWLDSVLELAVDARRARGEHAPLVIAVDGVDEAEWVRGMPLGLARNLPDGVVFVLTRRLGGPPLPLDGPVQRSVLRATADPNLDDMRTHLGFISRRPEFAGRLIDSDRDENWFVETMLARCKGVWLYLQYVEQEISHGRREIDELEDLPADLWGYYAATLTETRQHDPELWDGSALMMLAALAVAHEPVSFELACELAEVMPSLPLRRLLDNRWAPFLTVVPADRDTGAPLYAPAHVSFGDFMSGKVLWTEGDVRLDPGLIGELQGARAQVERRIVDRALDAWGSLERALPKLPHAPPDTLSEVNAYRWRRLTRHLAGAGRLDDLHVLLVLERGEPPANVWYAAHEAAGDLDGYLADLDVAQAAEQVDYGTRDGARTYSVEVHYALMAASLRTVAASYPPAVIARLVAEGRRSPEWALAQIRQLEPFSRLDGLTALACAEADVPTQAELMHVARAEAASDSDPFELLGRLAEIDPLRALEHVRLAEDSTVRLEFVRTVGALSEPQEQLFGTLYVAPIMTAAELEQAALAVADARGEILLARVATELVANMDHDQAERLVPRLLEAVSDVEGGDWRPLLVLGLLEHARGPLRARLAQTAWEDVRNEDDETFFAKAVRLVEHVPQAREAMIERLDGTSALDDTHAFALATLAAAVPAGERAALLAYLPRFAGQQSRAMAMAGIAEHLSDEHLAEVLTHAAELDDDGALAVVVAGIPKTPLGPMLGDMMGLEAISPVRWRVPHTPGLVARVGDDRVDRLVGLAARINAARPRARALRPLLMRLDPERASTQAEAELARLLTLIENRSDTNDEEDELSDGLLVLLPYLSPDGFALALTAGAALGASSRCWTLGAMVPHAPLVLRERVGQALLEAVETALEEGQSGVLIADVLRPAAAHLTDQEVAAAFELALAPGPNRLAMVGALVPRLSGEQQRRVIDESVECPPSLLDDDGDLVDSMLPYLGPPELEHLLASLSRIDDDEERVFGLMRLPAHLSNGGRRALERHALALTDPESRARLLAAIGPQWAAEVARTCLQDGRLVDFRRWSAEFRHPLVFAAGALEGKQLEDLSGAIGLELSDRSHRGLVSEFDAILGAVAPRLPVTDIAALIEIVWRDVPRRVQPRLLAALAPHASPSEQRRIIEEALEWKGDERAATLVSLLGTAVAPDVSECLQAILGVRDNEEGRRLVGIVAPHVSRCHIDLVLDVVRRGAASAILGPLLARADERHLEAAANLARAGRLESDDLVVLLECLDPHACDQLIADLLADEGSDAHQRWAALGPTLAYLPAGERRKFAFDALAATDEIGDAYLRWYLPYLTVDDLVEAREADPGSVKRCLLAQHERGAIVWSQVRQAMSGGSREWVVELLTTTVTIGQAGKTDYADGLMAAIVQSARWWP